MLGNNLEIAPDHDWATLRGLGVAAPAPEATASGRSGVVGAEDPHIGGDVPGKAGKWGQSKPCFTKNVS